MSSFTSRIEICTSIKIISSIVADFHGTLSKLKSSIEFKCHFLELSEARLLGANKWRFHGGKLVEAEKLLCSDGIK